MSAFVVESDHIDLMVTIAIRSCGWNEQYVNIPETADKLGQDLWNENYASINYRYDEEEPAPEYHWTPVAEYQAEELTNLQLVQVVKAAHCYGYQTCEHPGWKDSKAYWACQAVELWAASELHLRGLKQQTDRWGSKSWPGESRDQIQWEWSRQRAAELAEGAEA